MEVGGVVSLDNLILLYLCVLSRVLQVFVYFSVIFINDFPLLVEMNTNGTDVISVALRAENPAVCQNLQGTFTRILQSRN